MSTTKSKPPVLIYTDGACHGNPGPGGWGAYMHNGIEVRELRGIEPGVTTNQRMELLAAIKALQFFKAPRSLTIRSDSKYLVDGITKWLPSWTARKWKNAQGKPVANQDFWMTLQALAAQHEITWEWVKGHSGEPGNERADALASAACAEAVARAAQLVPVH